MHKRERTVLLDVDFLIFVAAQSHDKIDDTLIYDLVEEVLVVGQERDGEHSIGPDDRRIARVRDLYHELEQANLLDVVVHVLVERNQRGQPRQLFEDAYILTVARVTGAR